MSAAYILEKKPEDCSRQRDSAGAAFFLFYRYLQL
jgi:hypothetical protein